MVLASEQYTYPDNVWDQLARLDVICNHHRDVVLMRIQMHTFRPDLMTLTSVHLGPSEPPNVMPRFEAFSHLPPSPWVNDPRNATLIPLVEPDAQEHTQWTFRCSALGCRANIEIGADKAESIAFQILEAIALPGARCVMTIGLDQWSPIVRISAQRSQT